MKVLGGDVIARMLKEEGVEKVFGIIDGTYFGFYSSLEKHGIELISPRHETSAVHMAATYARLTGKIGVCMASNGPGVANLLPGVAVEEAEGNRVLCITSSRRPQIIYPDRGGAYQFFDHVGVIGAMSKFSQPVRFPERIVEIMRQAFRASYKGRPGVVHVDVPENILNSKVEIDEGVFLKPSEYRNTQPLYPNPDVVEKAAKMIAGAKFPIMHVGSGIIHSNAFYELKEVAELAYMPVTTSWAARGALCEENALSMPMIHVEVNNDLRNDADLVLVVGTRMGETDWWGKEPNWANPNAQKVIQVDIEDEWIGRNKKVDLGIIADAKVFLGQLAHRLSEMKNEATLAQRKEAYQKHLLKRDKHREKLDKNLEDFSSPMNTAHVAHIAKKKFAKDAVAIFDGGNTAVWGQFFYKCTTPGHGISTPKMGMLGAGVSQAVGAKVAKPNNQVYCIIGDGAMGFHMQEIETAVRNNLPVVYMVVTDKQWGMVKMNQQFQLKPIQALIDNKIHKKPLDEAINADFSEIEWDKLAQSMGAFGIRVNNPKDLESAIDKCLASQKASVIHIDVDPLKHMWAPSLQEFKKMHQEPGE
jgi:acetolactate synthase-1/2/3 large subunit